MGIARFADRVAAETISTGTGNMTVGAARPGYQTWSAGFADGFVYYGIIDENTGDWEVGEGTLTAATISRDRVVSSSVGNALVPFAPGSKTIYSPAVSESLIMDQGLF